MRCLWLEGSGLPVVVSESLSAALSSEDPAALELIAVGDIMLGGNVEARMKTIGTNCLVANDGLQSLLAGAGIAFGNLECAISDRGTRQDKAYTFRAEPEPAQALADAGFDMPCLASTLAPPASFAAVTEALALPSRRPTN